MTSLRGAERRSNPDCITVYILDCFASLAMTVPFEFESKSLRPACWEYYPAPTAFLRQARCTAQVQPGGCDRSSFASMSLAGAAEKVGSFGIASRKERSCAD